MIAPSMRKLTFSIAQHYLTHLLREKLEADKSRVIIVSSGAVRRVSGTGTAAVFPFVRKYQMTDATF